MEAELVRLAERDHRANHQDTAGALVEMRSLPELAPRNTRDEVLEFFIERGLVLDRAIDPFVAKDLTALGHAVFVALLVVHRLTLISFAHDLIRKPVSTFRDHARRKSVTVLA